MMKKSGIAVLVGIGAAAAGAACTAAWYMMKKNAEQSVIEKSTGLTIEGVDVDGDGASDMLMVDTDGDGTVDTVLADTTGDGNVDTIMVDTDGDGTLDTMLIDEQGTGEFVIASGIEETEEESIPEE